MNTRRKWVFTKDQLYSMHVAQEMSCVAIAKKIGCGTHTIASAIDRFGIPRRKQRQWAVPWNRDELYRLYWTEKRTISEIAKIKNCKRSIIQVKLVQFGIPRKKNPITWDREELERLYITEGLSATKVGKIIGVTGMSVLRALKIFGIPVRKSGDKSRGKRGNNWQGGRHVGPGGYMIVKLMPDDFYFPMAPKSRYVKEHRLIMAKHLGRCLHAWELVHHINHNKLDNRIENLQLVTDERHQQITILENEIKRLRAENQKLKEQRLMAMVEAVGS